MPHTTTAPGQIASSSSPNGLPASGLPAPFSLCPSPPFAEALPGASKQRPLLRAGTVIRQGLALQTLVQTLGLDVDIPAGLQIRGERQALAAGELLASTTETDAWVVVVERGVLQQTQLGVVPQVSLCARGEALCVGSPAALERLTFAPASSSLTRVRVQALSSADICVVPAAEMRRLEEQFGLFSEIVVKTLSVRLLREAVLSSSLASVPASQRVALGLGELARLAERAGIGNGVDPQQMLELSLPVSDLAYWLRVPVSTVDTVLRMLERQQMLSTLPARIVALATAALRNLADSMSPLTQVDDEALAGA